MRRILASLSSAAVTLGLLVGVAPGAQAADLGTVTITYTGGGYTLSPSSIAGQVLDTFTFRNGAGSTLTIRNSTGRVSAGITSCESTDCPVNGGASLVLTVDQLGSIEVRDVGGTLTRATLTITAGGLAGATDPALVYPTLYLNANGGTCTGTMQFTKYNGQNGTVNLPTAEQCTRTGFTFRGWALSTTATTSGLTRMVPIGDESFTLYAVWRPDGLLLTYDANVGMNTECFTDGVNRATSAERSTSTVMTRAASDEAIRWDETNVVRWAAAAPAPVCSPVGYRFLGWSAQPSGPARAIAEVGTIVTQFPGNPTGILFEADQVTLYAQWGVTWGVGLAASSQSLDPGGSTMITVTALRNGAADTGAPRQLQLTATGSVTFAGGATTTTLTTNDAGTGTVTVIGGQAAGSGTVSAAYGNSTQALEFTVASPQSASIVITGERTTVSGKSGIRIDGTTAGIREGARVVPWIRFPGQTTFTAGSARPTVDSQGGFSWERKTGKRVTVYVTLDADGWVSSNRVTIQAQ